VTIKFKLSASTHPKPHGKNKLYPQSYKIIGRLKSDLAGRFEASQSSS